MSITTSIPEPNGALIMEFQPVTPGVYIFAPREVCEDKYVNGAPQPGPKPGCDRDKVVKEAIDRDAIPNFLPWVESDKEDTFVDVEGKDKDFLVDGIYHIKMSDGFIYRGQRLGGAWELNDAAGHVAPLHHEEFMPIRFYPDAKITGGLKYGQG